MSEPFPSLIVSAAGFAAQGAFAQAQADVLDPDPDVVARLDALLRSRNAGVVAHFYMDPELQGVLYALAWPHVFVSDSLLMADRGVAMAKAGAGEIIVLGVDSMSENVRAILDEAGYATTGCHRVAAEPIGCSLAEAAESRAYLAYLDEAAATPKALHVVYINTSLRTKAEAQHRVPTITCTSSNVVRTVLQTFAQEPDAHVFFGPDTYMGHNLHALFESLLALPEAAIRALHPAHDHASLRALLPRFHWFRQGNCVVHHMFGAKVVEQVARDYADVDITAHLEVPSEMFALALAAQQRGRGVVGSTADILRHVLARVDEAVARGSTERLRFVLGTEAGMVTAIVRGLRDRLARDPQLEVEIIFPVASEAIATTQDDALRVIPGIAGGEGCSTAGGCATCPFMKMNSLDALFDLLERLPPAGDAVPRELAAFEPETYRETIAGQSIASLGTLPILHMRGFQASGRLPEALVADMHAR